MPSTLRPRLSQSLSAEEAGSGFRPTTGMAVAVLVLLVVSNGPLFVCMPLTNDTALYDLQARVVREGGVPYRDILEPNLPGVLWVHVAVRSLLGERSEVMRMFDLSLFGVIVFLLTRWLRAAGRSTVVQAWTAAALLLFYFSVSEWSHCQRDVWLLVPALGGLHLRRRQGLRVASEPTLRSVFAWAAAEGAVWGSAVWLKPMVVIPMLAAWIVSAMHMRRRRWIACDLGGLLVGGLLVGGAGIAWLAWSGGWPFFWETLVEWNARYFTAGKEHWTAVRFAAMAYRLFPWILLHLAAVPCAALEVSAWLWRKEGPLARDARFSLALFAAFYLAWLVQSFFLQHLFDYVHAPGILLAVMLLSAIPWSPAPSRACRLAATGVLAVAVLVSPALHGDRLSLWARCWTEGSTPEIRNRLAHIQYPNWEDLDRAAKFLRSQNLRDGELTCFHNDLVYLYNELNLRPSTRFVYVEALLVFFPERRGEIRAALASSRQRFLVTDMATAGLTQEELQAGSQGENAHLPPAFPEELKGRFPWSYPIAFRAGSIIIQRPVKKSIKPEPP